MQGASLLNGFEFDPPTFFENCLAAPEVDGLRVATIDCRHWLPISFVVG